jgi:hypothetical protein
VDKALEAKEVAVSAVEARCTTKNLPLVEGCP